MRRRHLVIMARAPQAGRVKSRLAAAVGPVEALRCYRVLLEQTMRRLAWDGRWSTWLAVTPDKAAPRLAAQLGGGTVSVIAQGVGGLGERMQRLMDRLPPGPVVIVGSDIPTIGRGVVASAFRALGGSDAVFGPADDGGYWLVGQRRTPKTLRLFEAVRWSSEHALSDTLENLDGREFSFVSTMTDVDDEETYLRWRRGWSGMQSGGVTRPAAAPTPTLPPEGGGSRRRSVRTPPPRGEGLGVGSWPECRPKY